MYINDHSQINDEFDPRNEVPKEQIRVTIGDVSRERNIVSRWCELTRADGQQFGITGESFLQPGKVELWDSIDVTLGKTANGKVLTRVWVTKGDSATTVPQSERKGVGKRQLFYSMYTALINTRTSEKAASLHASKL